MKILVLLEHDQRTIRLASRSAIGFARSVSGEPGVTIECLALGHDLGFVAADAARYASVLTVDHEALEHPLADRYARVIAEVATARRVELLVAASGTFSRDILPRAAALLGGVMVSEVIGHERRDGELVFRRPMYAGAVTATVRLIGGPKVVTVRPSAYEPVAESDTGFDMESIEIDGASLPDHITFEGVASKKSARPDVTEARIVVSGGRAIKNSEDFERLIGGLADAVGGATGSSRALVDAGITPNELQVGQTGKIVAPDLYLALGISGAVQHLAGMKNSKVIAAINTDPDAPIFEMADFGLVADIYEVVPRMIERLSVAVESTTVDR